jgi:hypothetical protein
MLPLQHTPLWMMSNDFISITKLLIQNTGKIHLICASLNMKHIEICFK